MILTKLTREDALKVLELGKALHKESRYRDSPFLDDKVLRLFSLTVEKPDKVFVAYDDEFTGFILMSMQEDYFSDTKYVADFCLYVKPEHRGSPLAKQLVEAGEQWATDGGAYEVRLGHSTGIRSDKAIKVFEGFGYELTGYLFKKGIK